MREIMDKIISTQHLPFCRQDIHPVSRVQATTSWDMK